MSTRPTTRTRTAAAAAAKPGVPPAAARPGLSDITNRTTAAVRRAPPADKKPPLRATAAAARRVPAVGKEKETEKDKPHPAASGSGTGTGSGSVAARATVRRTASVHAKQPVPGKAPLPHPHALSHPHAHAHAHAHARAPSSLAKVPEARVRVPVGTAAAASTSASASSVAGTAASSRQGSVKRIASRSELLPVDPKKPRLDPALTLSHQHPSVRPAVSVAEPAVVPAAPPKDAGWQDLDEADKYDPIMAVEYADEVFAYMKELEVKTVPSDAHLKHQVEIKVSHRSTLVDWLINIHYKLQLLPETLFLAVNIVDRTLSSGFVALANFQLLGTTCLFIAAKYEEMAPPAIETISICGGDLFGEEEIRVCERDILRKLEFDLSYPNPMNFIRRISKADDYDVETRTVAKYLVEIAVVDWRLLAHPPSVQAAAAFWLARHILDRGHWGPNLVHYSTYAESELLATAEVMLDYVLRQPPSSRTTTGVVTGSERHPKLFKKYSARRFFAVAPYVREWAAKSFPQSLMSSQGEPEADDPIAVDLFTDRGYARPDAATLVRIFNLDDSASTLPQDDGGLAPMPFSPQRAVTSVPLSSPSAAGLVGMPMHSSSSGMSGTGSHASSSNSSSSSSGRGVGRGGAGAGGSSGTSPSKDHTLAEEDADDEMAAASFLNEHPLKDEDSPAQVSDEI